MFSLVIFLIFVNHFTPKTEKALMLPQFFTNLHEK